MHDEFFVWCLKIEVFCNTWLSTSNFDATTSYALWSCYWWLYGVIWFQVWNLLLWTVLLLRSTMLICLPSLSLVVWWITLSLALLLPWSGRARMLLQLAERLSEPQTQLNLSLELSVVTLPLTLEGIDLFSSSFKQVYVFKSFVLTHEYESVFIVVHVSNLVWWMLGFHFCCLIFNFSRIFFLFTTLVSNVLCFREKSVVLNQFCEYCNMFMTSSIKQDDNTVEYIIIKGVESNKSMFCILYSWKSKLLF